MSFVDITSYWDNDLGTETREAKQFYAVPYDIPKGSASAYFPEANVLVPVHSTALESNTPTSLSIKISIETSSPT